jgi:hypothetical protein
MEAKRSQFVLKLLPSFTDFAFLMPIAYLFGILGGAKSLLNDGDTGWHIRTGEWILANRAVPKVDPFSFSKPGEPWFAWEWLSDVVLAWLNSVDGLRAVTLFSIALICATFTLLYLLARRKSNVIVAIWITMMAAAASSIHWLARPHLFTLLFLVVFYHGLERVREGKRTVAGIPWFGVFAAITLLWTQLHGGFFVGILMICAYGGGEFLEVLLSGDAEERKSARQRARGYFLCAAACAAVSLINPYTYHLHVHMAQYLRNPWNSEHIVEFLSPSFHHARAIYFEAIMALGLASAWWSFTKRQYTELLLVGVWAHAGLLASRNIPIFVIVAAPIIAAAVQHALNHAADANVAGWVRTLALRFNRIVAQTAEKEAVSRWHLVSMAGFAMMAAVFFAPNPPTKFLAEFDPKRYPEAALAAMRPGSGARIFTNDEWGDYLIWSLYPAGRVFVDGRSDFYGNDFENSVLDILHVKYGWEKTLATFEVDTILMPPDAPLTGALKESSRWRIVYDDGRALVFRSNERTAGEPISAANGDGTGRDREVTKTRTSDRPITDNKTKS